MKFDPWDDNDGLFGKYEGIFDVVCVLTILSAVGYFAYKLFTI